MDLLKNNEITFTRLAKDTLIEVESYKIADYKTSSALMKDTISIEILNWCLRWKSSLSPGDYVVETRQKGVKYL
jgi:hypothetical protein